MRPLSAQRKRAKTRFACLLAGLILTWCHSAFALSVDEVFTDAYQNDFQSNHWSDITETIQTSVVNSGSSALQITHNTGTGWDAFTIIRGNWNNLVYMYPSQYQTLSFYFNPGPNTGEVPHLVIGLQDNYTVPLSDYLPGGSATPNQWHEVRIPVAQMCAPDGSFFRIVFFNNSSNSGFQYYLDDITLEWEEDTEPPVISNVLVDNSKSYKAVISWNTDEPTSFDFEYGILAVTENRIESSQISQSHLVTLYDLNAQTTYLFRITAKDVRENPEDILSSEYTSSFTTPEETEPEQVTFTIDTSMDVHPISPYIYGANFGYNGRALERSGGNRWTAYNWENNASHAGSDWYHQNDGFLVMNWSSEYVNLGYTQDTPGAAVWRRIRNARMNSAAALVTIPIVGHVSEDKNGGGDVGQTYDFLISRFVPSHAVKPGSFSLNPDSNDNAVYQDEFVNWVETTFFPGGREMHPDSPSIFYCLDNEPGLWASTHPRVHPLPSHYAEYLAGTRNYADVDGAKVTYEELVNLNINYSSAIKDVVPQAKVFGFVSYGYNGFITLQDAPDANNRNFLDHYLTQMQDAHSNQTRRLIDVLDLHWYPEARGDGTRITSANSTPGLVSARVQAPRSLWDSTYEETSWIRDYIGGPIRLIPMLKEKINAFYPGTLLAITEYHYGGGNHISGGIAQADVLGVYGRQDLFAAALWTENQDNSFIYGGFDMFRNFDGSNKSFGDISISAVTQDVEKTSVYASLDSKSPQRMVIVAINKTAEPLQADIQINHNRRFSRVRVFQLTENSSTPVEKDPIPVKANHVSYRMPPYSVSTLELTAAISIPYGLFLEYE